MTTSLRIGLISICLAWTGCEEYYIGNTLSCDYEPVPEIASHPKNADFTNLLNSYVKKGLPGVSLYVNDPDGLWIGAAGYADIKEKTRFTPCHISKVASITKMFVAVVALQLVEENVLQLDEPVAQYLPGEVLDHVKNSRTVTLHQLLNHTSGIYDLIDNNKFYLDVLNNPAKKRSLMELVKFAYDEPAVFSPGSDAGYSNTNTLLVSLVLEHVTGDSHEQLLKERILDPLGLHDTYYGNFDVLPSNTAQGYFDLYNTNTIVNVSNYFTAYGYGGMYSTLADLKVFISALLIDKTLLTEESLQTMLTFNPKVENGKLLGTGIFKDFIDLGEDKYAYGHRGRDLGYTADLFWFPNQNTIMVMFLNYGTDSESDLREVFYDFREDLGHLITDD